MTDGSIYRPYSRLVRIKINERWFETPENNILLRCFQYLAPEIPFGPFCWNGDCENDQIRCRQAGTADARSALSCQTMVREGMEIEIISPELRRAIASAFQKTEGEEGAPAEESPTSEPAPASST